MANKLIYMDGQKSVDLWDGDEGWKILSGDTEATPTREYYKFIPTLYRAVQLRMYSVANMPFELVKGNTVFDSSDEWENKIGFLPNPFMLLQLIEASLMIAGCAYLFRDRSAVTTKKLTYHLPGSVTPIIDPVRGLTGFKRPVNSVDRTFKVDDYIYFWTPDPYVEIGPAINFPAQAAANASGVLLNMDIFAASFMKRGAIKVTLLSVKGMPKPAEREKLEDWWSNLVSGVKNAFTGKVINADAVTPTVIGEGLKELENTTISEEKREDIAVALGIPMSILFANAANYATSQQDELNFLKLTVIPDCEFIAAVLNEQLFEPLGLHLQFKPETLDAMQEDEAARAAALQQLTSAGVPLLMAMDLLGFELTDEQRAELEQAIIDKEERAEEMAARLAQKPAEDQAAQDETQADENTPSPSPQEAPGQAQEEKRLSDMDKWQRKAIKALRRGESAVVAFDSEYINVIEWNRINTALADARTDADVRVVFDGDNHNGKPDATSIKELTEALRSVAIAMREKDGLDNQ